MKRKYEQGITLIALVVTIVVLLILAGISIAMLTGENGVISQAKSAKEATEQAKVEELVSVAIGSVISKNNGSTAGITPKMIADQINEDERRSDVYAEDETTFPTNIIFPKEKRKAEANFNAGKFVANEDSIYSTEVNEADIAPLDLFDYEIINDGTTGALTLDSLPTKTVRITRIKPEYCNHYGYNPDTENWDYTDTNYEIIYKGTNISKTLIIPYQVDGKYIPNGIEGEYYKVTEVSLIIEEVELDTGNSATTSIPNVEELIYPNTVKKIINNYENMEISVCSNTNNLKTVVLSNNITEIPEFFFYNAKIENIVIPDKVTSIGKKAFYGCTNLRNVTIGDGIKVIQIETFANCDNLTSLIIGKNLTDLNWFHFSRYNHLEEIKVSEENPKYDSRDNCNAIIETDTNTLIQGCSTTTIPDDVTTIEKGAFYSLDKLTSIRIPKSVTSIKNHAFFVCNNLTTINYTGTQEEWNKITIEEDGNDILKSDTVTINYNCK